MKRTSRENHFLVYFESENSAKTFGVVCFIDVEKPSMSIGREYQLPFAGHVNQQPAKHPSTREKYLEREGSGRKPTTNSHVHIKDKEALLYRAVAIESSQTKSLIATPIIDPGSYIEDAGIFKKTPVYQAVIHEFPVPSSIVPFEDLLMLRAEEEFKLRRNALRSWIRNISVREMSKNEIIEEIRYLLNQYENYMRIQKIKYSRPNLSGILKFSASLLEDTVKLKAKDLTESICPVFCQNINLVEAEINAPGRELAYIATSK